MLFRERHYEEERCDRKLDYERHERDQAARKPVGERAGGECERKKRRELAQADEAEVERVAVNRIDLPADRDGHHLRREAAQEIRAEEQREVALAQRGGKAAPHTSERSNRVDSRPMANHAETTREKLEL